MPYQRIWHEGVPAGTLPANQIDTEFQNLKADLRERLEQAIPGFADDLTDPKRVRAVYAGTLAVRPDPASLGQSRGVVYIATDEGRTYYTDNNGAWQTWPQSHPDHDPGSEVNHRSISGQGDISNQASVVQNAYFFSAIVEGATGVAGEFRVREAELPFMIDQVLTVSATVPFADSGSGAATQNYRVEIELDRTGTNILLRLRDIGTGNLVNSQFRLYLFVTYYIP